MPRPQPLTGIQISRIARVCTEQGYDFRLALRTAQRDGKPYFRKAAESFERQLAAHRR